MVDDGAFRTALLERSIQVSLSLTAVVGIGRDEMNFCVVMRKSCHVPIANTGGAASDKRDSTGEVRDLVGPEAFAEKSRWVQSIGQDGSHSGGASGAGEAHDAQAAWKD